MQLEEPSVTTRRLKIRVTVGLYGIMAAISLAWGLYRDRPAIWVHPDPLFELPWQVVVPLGACAGISLGLGLAWISRWLVGRTGWARKLLEEFWSLLGGLDRKEILLIAALSSVGEELFFRGVLQPGIGLIGSSLLFGFAHVPTSLRMIPWTLQAVFMGFVLGGLFVFTGDLTICVMTHFVVNASNLAYIQSIGGSGKNVDPG